MMNRIIISKKEPCISVDEVCIQNGFIRNRKDGVYRHELLREYFCTSPYNSENLWEKESRLYLFDGWINVGRNPKDWNSIELVDVTDLLMKA